MSKNPIFVATHPRAISTAFERVFMTQRDIIKTVHEPFGDAYYFGPERLAERYADDAGAIEKSGFANTTYKNTMEAFQRDMEEGKRILIKDMAQYLIPPSGKPVSVAPSLSFKKRGIGTTKLVEESDLVDYEGFKTRSDISEGATPQPGAPYPTHVEPGNPTIVPLDLLKQFQFVFLIRNPKAAIPSYYRCCIDPLKDMTGFDGFRNDEAGFSELRTLFDFVRGTGMIGPEIAGKQVHLNGYTNGHTHHENGDLNMKHEQHQICVIDADDLLDKPAEVVQVFCESVGIRFDPNMLNWDSEEEEQYAAKAFEKWKGFHEDVIHSQGLKPRGHRRIKSIDESYAEWIEKYGRYGADIIDQAVQENMEHYEYLKQFCIKI